MLRVRNRILGIAFVLAAAYGMRAETLTVQTTETLLPLSHKWAQAYSAKHPEIIINVSGGGAPAAFVALAEKRVDLALATRMIRHKEAESCITALGQRPAEYKVAVNAVAIYVNTNNPVKVLSYDDLTSIYSGQTKSWKDFDGGDDATISLFTQAADTIPGELFGEEILAGKTPSPEAHIISEPDLIKAVANDPKAIGYGAPGVVDGVRPASVKRVFSSKAVLPTEAGITNRAYPISRFVYGYLNPASSNQTQLKAYLDWIRSDEGQQIAREAGFFPTAPKWRTTP